MKQEFMTKKELKTAVDAFVEKAKLADQKWLYCYFTELEDWPLITDEIKIKEVKQEPVAAGYNWDGGEKCPFDK